jgi:hypothetical protein
MGFNLTQYRANPLASIGTTLRRMVPSQLESKMLRDGQVVYQRRLTLIDQMARANLEKINQHRDKLLRQGGTDPEDLKRQLKES